MGEGSVWVAVNQGDRLAVLEIGPELGELRDTITLHTSEFGSLSVLRESVVLTIGDRALWALERGRGEVTRIDPETGATKRLAEGHGASSSIAVGAGAIWLGGINGVVKLDPATGIQLGNVFVGEIVDSTATSIALGADATWFTANSRARLWLIPPKGNAVDDSFAVGDGPSSVAVDPAGDRLGGIERRRLGVASRPPAGLSGADHDRLVAGHDSRRVRPRVDEPRRAAARRLSPSLRPPDGVASPANGGCGEAKGRGFPFSARGGSGVGGRSRPAPGLGRGRGAEGRHAARQPVLGRRLRRSRARLLPVVVGDRVRDVRKAVQLPGRCRCGRDAHRPRGRRPVHDLEGRTHLHLRAEEDLPLPHRCGRHRAELRGCDQPGRPAEARLAGDKLHAGDRRRGGGDRWPGDSRSRESRCSAATDCRSG